MGDYDKMNEKINDKTKRVQTDNLDLMVLGNIMGFEAHQN